LIPVLLKILAELDNSKATTFSDVPSITKSPRNDGLSVPFSPGPHTELSELTPIARSMIKFLDSDPGMDKLRKAAECLKNENKSTLATYLAKQLQLMYHLLYSIDYSYIYRF